MWTVESNIVAFLYNVIDEKNSSSCGKDGKTTRCHGNDHITIVQVELSTTALTISLMIGFFKHSVWLFSSETRTVDNTNFVLT